MNELRISLADIGDDGKVLDLEVDPAALQPEGAEALPITRLKVTGRVTWMEPEVLFRGCMEGAFERDCDRCLDALVMPFRLEVDWFFESGEGDGGDDEGAFFLDGDVVDVGRYVWEELVFGFPSKYVCGEGVPCANPEVRDLMLDGYGAEEPEESAPRPNSEFAKLKDMFPDLVRDEEKE